MLTGRIEAVNAVGISCEVAIGSLLVALAMSPESRLVLVVIPRTSDVRPVSRVVVRLEVIEMTPVAKTLTLVLSTTAKLKVLLSVGTGTSDVMKRLRVGVVETRTLVNRLELASTDSDDKARALVVGDAESEVVKTSRTEAVLRMLVARFEPPRSTPVGDIVASVVRELPMSRVLVTSGIDTDVAKDVGTTSTIELTLIRLVVTFEVPMTMSVGSIMALVVTLLAKSRILVTMSMTELALMKLVVGLKLPIAVSVGKSTALVVTLPSGSMVLVTSGGNAPDDVGKMSEAAVVLRSSSTEPELPEPGSVGRLAALVVTVTPRSKLLGTLSGDTIDDVVTPFNAELVPTISGSILELLNANAVGRATALVV